MPDGAMSMSTPSSGESAADQRATRAKPHLYRSDRGPRSFGGGPGSCQTCQSVPSRRWTARCSPDSAKGVTRPHSGVMNSGVSVTGNPAWSAKSYTESGCQRSGSCRSGLPGSAGERSGLNGR